MSAAPEPLREEDLDADPVRQFAAWFAAAAEAGIHAPEAAALATATHDGQPSLRMVLVKRADAEGFVFYTNYGSRKGRELAANPFAALMFHWEALGRQVRIEGRVDPTSAEETAAYVRTRPRASQLSALASPQSSVIPDRAGLERRVAELAEAYADAELPLPKGWGGFRLVPDVYEFWQQRPDRLHDRLRYRRVEGQGVAAGAAGALTGGRGWRLERLAP